MEIKVDFKNVNIKKTRKNTLHWNNLSCQSFCHFTIVSSIGIPNKSSITSFGREEEMILLWCHWWLWQWAEHSFGTKDYYVFMEFFTTPPPVHSFSLHLHLEHLKWNSVTRFSFIYWLMRLLAMLWAKIASVNNLLLGKQIPELFSFLISLAAKYQYQ